jgi:hypothetical protein
MSTGERIEQGLKIIGVLVAAAGFLWGIYQYFDKRDREIENARIEAARPFLERQLKLYTEASQMTSVLATSADATELQAAEKRFWQLYWGELALVENEQVKEAMEDFGRGLDSENRSQQQLRQLSFALANALRDSLADSWGTEHWRRGAITGND